METTLPVVTSHLGRPRKKPRRKTDARAVERQDLAIAEHAALPRALSLMQPGKREEWLAGLEAPDVTPTPESEDAAHDVVAAAVDEWNRTHEETGEPFEMLPELARFGNAFVALVGGVARGEKQEAWAKESGLTWTRAQMFARVDPDGFGRIWKMAWRMRDETSSRRVHEKAVKRVIDGDAVPVVGRQEGGGEAIIGEKVTYSDRLTEYLIEETKPKEERVAAPLVDASTKTTQVIGQQIVYKLPDLPAWFKDLPGAKKPKTIDAKVVGK